MTLPRLTESPLVRHAGFSFFPIAFIARLPFAMMVVGVLTLVVAERDSVALGGLNAAVAGIGTALAGPLLGAAADRLGQRRVLVPLGLLNAVLLGAFVLVVGSSAPDLAVLALSVLIGASAPQVPPLSRTRLVAIIKQKVAPDRRESLLNGTMAYESAADEMVFIVGPFLVGLLATAIAPWVAIAGAAVLTSVFVTAFALHPTGRLQPGTAEHRAAQAPARELVTSPLMTVVAGTLGVGIFFGATLTSLTGFLADERRRRPRRPALRRHGHRLRGAGPRLGGPPPAVHPQGALARVRLTAPRRGHRLRHRPLGDRPPHRPRRPRVRHRADARRALQPRRDAQPGRPLGDHHDDARLRRRRRPGGRLRGHRRRRRPVGPATALVLPALAAALVVAAGLAHRAPTPQPAEPARELVHA